jgi:hypothetical protein
MHELENELVKPMEWTCSEPDVHSSTGRSSEDSRPVMA